jgi:hypothetical protein
MKFPDKVKHLWKTLKTPGLRDFTRYMPQCRLFAGWLRAPCSALNWSLVMNGCRLSAIEYNVGYARTRNIDFVIAHKMSGKFLNCNSPFFI